MFKQLLFIPLFMAATASAQTVVFTENFDGNTTSNWMISDRDGDEENWEILNAEVNEVVGFTGNFAVSFSWYLEAFTPDNLLISPQINLPTSSNLKLSYKVAAGDPDVNAEHYAVYVIPASAVFAGTETAVYEETLSSDVVKTVTVDVSAYSGQNVKIIFRHYNCTDQFYMGIDDITVVDNATLATVEQLKDELVLFPNPVSNGLNISGASKINELKVFDMNGRIMDVRQTGNTLDFSKLKTGIYIVSGEADGKGFTRKIIKK